MRLTCDGGSLVGCSSSATPTAATSPSVASGTAHLSTLHAHLSAAATPCCGATSVPAAIAAAVSSVTTPATGVVIPAAAVATPSLVVAPLSSPSSLSASSSAATSSAEASAHSSGRVLDGDLLDLDLLSIDVDGGLFEQCFCGLFFVERDEAKVFGLAVFTPVNGSLDFDDVPVLREVVLDLVLGDRLGEFSDVDLQQVKGGSDCYSTFQNSNFNGFILFYLTDSQGILRLLYRTKSSDS